jgi:hypothetical protein
MNQKVYRKGITTSREECREECHEAERERPELLQRSYFNYLSTIT